MISSFWVGGSERYSAEIDRQYKVKVGELRELLRECDDAFSYKKLKAEIEQVKSEYREQRRKLWRSIF